MFMIPKYITNVHNKQNISAYVEYNYVFEYLAQALKTPFVLDFCKMLKLPVLLGPCI